MKFVADLHIHSHYSRATSKNLNFEHVSKWSQLKGIQIVGTGDIAHPGWLQEMKDKLEPAEEGLFRLKDEYSLAVQETVPMACQGPVRFMLAGEISSIYKKHDKVRKVHNVIFAPTLEAVEKIQVVLEKIGNIRSDGRPILGLPSRDLLEIILEVDPACHLIPAHIWTPWFSLLGSKSGYDSVESCFEDLTPHIFAVETGLSSDPPMNWRVSMLDRYTLVSNSDAHSPQKLAREATVFNTELSYPAIFEALKTGDPREFLGTIEFFPEEGKYHHDGHRKCDINWDPKETIAQHGLCSKCGKPVTVGVLHRIEMLADRTTGDPPRPHPFTSLIPLTEVLGEIHGVGPNTKTVRKVFELFLEKLGSELSILQEVPLEDIDQIGGARLAEGIRRMRSGQVKPIAGFDGRPGIIKLFDPQEDDVQSDQLSFFAPESSPKLIEQPSLKTRKTKAKKATLTASTSGLPDDSPMVETSAVSDQTVTASLADGEHHTPLTDLNDQQRKAVMTTDISLVIIAGPGTGKTRTLTYRIAYLITEKGVSPERLVAITFTNKAAEEMTQRLRILLGNVVANQITIKTFHSFGLMVLRSAEDVAGIPNGFAIIDDEYRRMLMKQLYPSLKEKAINQYLNEISQAKNQLLIPGSSDLSTENGQNTNFVEAYKAYEAALARHHLFDFDDLILRVVCLFENQADLLQHYQARFHWVSVDEYQDINLAQYRLLQLLTGPETNLCAIGDPDQAIYGFRGASPQFFDQFNRDFQPVKTHHLSRSYRSTQLILNASEQVIEKSAVSERVKVWSDFVDKTKLTVYQAPSDKAEAEYVVHEIEKMVGGTSYFSLDSDRVTDDDGLSARSFADFVVLYRTNAQSQLLSEAFQRSGIPFQTVGQTPLVQYKDMKMLLACLWFLYNPKNTFHLVQMTTKKQMNAIEAFLATLEDGAKKPISSLLDRTQQFLAERSILSLDAKGKERFQQLRQRAIPFEDHVDNFLEVMALQKETDFYDPRADRVTLMTLHAAKGLEFPVVFIVGCEEGLLPYQRDNIVSDIEEERRLFYVGMTRAQQRLVLTHTKSRYLFGQKMSNAPSPYLDDIEQIFKEIKRSTYRKPVKDKPAHAQLKLF